jgi:hypothetical protein
MKNSILMKKFGFTKNEINKFKRLPSFVRILNLKTLDALKKMRTKFKPGSYIELLVIKKIIEKIETFTEAFVLNKTISYSHEAKILMLEKMLDLSATHDEVKVVWEKREHSNYLFSNKIIKKLVSLSETDAELEEAKKIIEQKNSGVSGEFKYLLFEKKFSKVNSFDSAEALFHSVQNMHEKILCLGKMLEFASIENNLSKTKENLKKISRYTSFASIRYEIFQIAYALPEEIKEKVAVES